MEKSKSTVQEVIKPGLWSPQGIAAAPPALLEVNTRDMTMRRQIHFDLGRWVETQSYAGRFKKKLFFDAYRKILAT